MTNDTMTQHLTTEKIANYFGKLLSEEEESQVELHFAECDDCTQRARRWHAFSENWDSWTAQAHGEAYVRVAVERALQKAQEQENVPALRERLVHWREECFSKVKAAAHVIFEAPREVARVVTEGLEGLVRPEDNWQFALATTAVRTRGAARVRGRGVAPQQATGPAALGTPRALVTVSSAAGEIEIQVNRLPSRPETREPVRTRGGVAPSPEKLPLVLLVPTKEGGEPQLRQLEPDLSVRFTGVTSGDYLIVIEPLD